MFIYLNELNENFDFELNHKKRAKSFSFYEISLFIILMKFKRIEKMRMEHLKLL